MIQVSDLKNKFNKSYPTTQSDVDRLVKAKILYPVEGVRPKSYYSPEMMKIAYQDDPMVSDEQSEVEEVPI